MTIIASPNRHREVDIWIPVEPRPWQRASQRANGKRFTPIAMRRTQDAIKHHVQAQNVPSFGNAILRVRIEMYMPRPKKPRYNWPTKFDIDNGIKNLCDALNGILWDDDRQICELFAFKRWTKTNPGYRLVVAPLVQFE
jgi:Holliday junction resolvase RusA-like endonuclease